MAWNGLMQLDEVDDRMRYGTIGRAVGPAAEPAARGGNDESRYPFARIVNDRRPG